MAFCGISMPLDTWFGFFFTFETDFTKYNEAKNSSINWRNKYAVLNKT